MNLTCVSDSDQLADLSVAVHLRDELPYGGVPLRLTNQASQLFAEASVARGERVQKFRQRTQPLRIVRVVAGVGECRLNGRLPDQCALHRRGQTL